MDERSWGACSDPQVMLDFLGEGASARKLRLFDAACCRRVWALLGKESRKAVRAAEMFADGLLGPDELRRARLRAERSCQVNRKWWSLEGSRADAANRAAWCAADENKELGRAARLAAGASAVKGVATTTSGHRVAVMGMTDAGLCLLWRRRYGKDAKERERLRERRGAERSADGWWGERKVQADFLRCLFHPFLPVSLSADALTPPVLSLALAAYDGRNLPGGELDAVRLAVLADALEDAGEAGELTRHLRGPGPHIRGCFAVDAILRPGEAVCAALPSPLA